MIPAKFGSKKFEVSAKKIYTPDGLSYSEELNIEETEVKDKKPTITIKGIKLMPLDFEVILDSRFVDVEDELQFWQKTLLSKKSQTFVLGNTTLGKFYLTKRSVSDISMNRNGVYTRAKLALSFTEDPGEDKQPSGNAQAQSVKNSSTEARGVLANDTENKTFHTYVAHR